MSRSTSLWYTASDSNTNAPFCSDGASLRDKKKSLYFFEPVNLQVGIFRFHVLRLNSGLFSKSGRFSAAFVRNVIFVFASYFSNVAHTTTCSIPCVGTLTEMAQRFPIVEFRICNWPPETAQSNLLDNNVSWIKDHDHEPLSQNSTARWVEHNGSRFISHENWRQTLSHELHEFFTSFARKVWNIPYWKLCIQKRIQTTPNGMWFVCKTTISWNRARKCSVESFTFHLSYAGHKIS